MKFSHGMVQKFPRNCGIWGPDEVCLVDARNFQGIRGKLWMVERVFLNFLDLVRWMQNLPKKLCFFLSLSLLAGGGLGWGCSLLRQPLQLRAALSPPPLPQSPSLLLATGRLFSLLPLLSLFLPWALWRLVGIDSCSSAMGQSCWRSPLQAPGLASS